jgi:hypothetical protein
MRGLFQPLLMLMSRSTESDLAHQVEYLKAENEMLRRRLGKRPYVVAMEQAANGDFQDVVLVIENVMPADAVLAPRELEVSATAAGSVTLSWTDASDNETSFVIERSRRKSGVFELVGSVGAGATDFTDGGVVSGRRYYYRVRAINGQRSSLVSNRVAAVVP